MVADSRSTNGVFTQTVALLSKMSLKTPSIVIMNALNSILTCWKKLFENRGYQVWGDGVMKDAYLSQ